jgi:16S rRNA (guanine527-N7)-methyltransferase
MIASEADARQWLVSLPECGEVALERLESLVLLLREENSRQNLVSASSLEEVWRRHIADSAQLLALVPRGTSPWLDLGTGAGFPGLIVAALRPDCEVVMVESRAKRADWLDRARLALGLGEAQVVGSRLEQVETRKMAVISARAFAPLDRLLGLSARFSTRETLWLLPKGRSAQHELHRLKGWRHRFHVKQSLTEAEAGIIAGHLLGRKGKSA